MSSHAAIAYANSVAAIVRVLDPILLFLPVRAPTARCIWKTQCINQLEQVLSHRDCALNAAALFGSSEWAPEWQPAARVAGEPAARVEGEPAARVAGELRPGRRWNRRPGRRRNGGQGGGETGGQGGGGTGGQGGGGTGSQGGGGTGGQGAAEPAARVAAEPAARAAAEPAASGGRWGSSSASTWNSRAYRVSEYFCHGRSSQRVIGVSCLGSGLAISWPLLAGNDQ